LKEQKELLKEAKAHVEAAEKEVTAARVAKEFRKYCHTVRAQGSSLARPQSVAPHADTPSVSPLRRGSTASIDSPPAGAADMLRQRRGSTGSIGMTASISSFLAGTAPNAGPDGGAAPDAALDAAPGAAPDDTKGAAETTRHSNFGKGFNLLRRAVSAVAFVSSADMSGKALNFAQMAMALSSMTGGRYTDLCFRRNVAERQGARLERQASEDAETGVVIGTSAIYREASFTDTEEMLCFFRWLDDDCDGLISLDDFRKAVLPGERELALSTLAELEIRWHEYGFRPSTACSRPLPDGATPRSVILEREMQALFDKHHRDNWYDAGRRLIGDLRETQNDKKRDAGARNDYWTLAQFRYAAMQDPESFAEAKQARPREKPVRR